MVVPVIAFGVVPPIAGGLDKSKDPPNVKFPLDVTVPDNEMPLTVPVPDTDVTVPPPTAAVVSPVTRPYVSTVITGICVEDPVVPAVTMPLVKSTVGTVDVPPTVSVVDVIDVTVPTLTELPKAIALPLMVIVLFVNPLFGIVVLIALAGMLIVALAAAVN